MRPLCDHESLNHCLATLCAFHSADRDLAITQCFCSIVFQMNHKTLRRLWKPLFSPQRTELWILPFRQAMGPEILEVSWCFLICPFENWGKRWTSWTSWTAQASHWLWYLLEGAEPCFDFQCEVARVLWASRRDGAGGFWGTWTSLVWYSDFDASHEIQAKKDKGKSRVLGHPS